MAQIDEEIRESLRKFILQTVGGNTMLANVDSINENDKTIVLIDDDGIKKNNVRLRPIVDDKEGMTIFPKQGTWCLAIKMEDEDEDGEAWMAVAFGEVAKWRLKIDNTTIEATSNGIVFNGGQLGGMVKLNELVAKMNTLENSLNALKTVFNSWVVVPSDGGAALKAVVATWAASSITPTTANDLKNDKVKQ